MKTSKVPKPTRSNMWKVISLIFIGIFCVIVIGGLLKFYHGDSDSSEATPEQIATAQMLVEQDLSARGGDIANYHIDIARKARRHSEDDGKRTVIHVSLSNPTSQESYLIDLDSGKIVMHSMTVFYDWMANESNRHPPQREEFHEKH